MMEDVRANVPFSTIFFGYIRVGKSESRIDKDTGVVQLNDQSCCEICCYRSNVVGLSMLSE